MIRPVARGSNLTSKCTEMRQLDWEEALSDYLAGHGEAVFAWGECDCALFAGGAVSAMTGIDPSAEVRGRYKTALGSVRVLRRLGFDHLEDFVGHLFAEVPPCSAHRGDLVMVQGNLGICIGRMAVFVGEDNGEPGLVQRPMQDWEHAWRVPFAE